MISAKGRGRLYVEEQAHRGAIGALKHLEAGRKAEDVAREAGIEAHDLCLESKV
jgi:hypothetical protein